MMDAATLVVAESVTKKYCRSLQRSLWYGVCDLAGEMAGRGGKGRRQLRAGEFLALEDVSFRLGRGECLGIVGANGAGKSTLLKLLNGLMRPDAGCIRVRGRVGGLIELGAGFNPQLTGRENVYLNGAVLGLGRRDMDRRLEEIVEFAQLAPYIDAPLRTYSSGMRARLGFSVAVSSAPDVLLVDEVLAVGDAGFRARCHRKLSELLGRGCAVLLVSHNPHLLLSTCTSGLLLESGRLGAAGSMPEVLARYETAMLPAGSAQDAQGWRAPPGKPAAGQQARIEAVTFHDGTGQGVAALKTGGSALIRIQCHASEPVASAHVGVIVRAPGSGGETALFLSAKADGVTLPLVAGVNTVDLALSPVVLRPGFYSAKITLQVPPFHTLDRVDEVCFRVEAGADPGASTFFQPHTWQIGTGGH